MRFNEIFASRHADNGRHHPTGVAHQGIVSAGHCVVVCRRDIKRGARGTHRRPGLAPSPASTRAARGESGGWRIRSRAACGTRGPVEDVGSGAADERAGGAGSAADEGGERRLVWAAGTRGGVRQGVVAVQARGTGGRPRVGISACWTWHTLATHHSSACSTGETQGRVAG